MEFEHNPRFSHYASLFTIGICFTHQIEALCSHFPIRGKGFGESRGGLS